MTVGSTASRVRREPRDTPTGVGYGRRGSAARRRQPARRARRTEPDAVPRARSPRPGDRGHPRARAARSPIRGHLARALPREPGRGRGRPGDDTVVPNRIARFDDELPTIGGTLTDTTDLTAGGHGHRHDGPAGRQAPAPQPRGRSGDATQGQGQRPVVGRSRPRIDIDGGRPVPAAAPHARTQRPAQCAGRRAPPWEERRPRTEGGCAGGVGRPRSGRGS